MIYVLLPLIIIEPLKESYYHQRRLILLFNNLLKNNTSFNRLKNSANNYRFHRIIKTRIK